MALKDWKKIRENNNGIFFQNKKHKTIRSHLRWNPVTRRWQVYITDGVIEIKDFGNFKDSEKDSAERKLYGYMKKH